METQATATDVVCEKNHLTTSELYVFQRRFGIDHATMFELILYSYNTPNILQAFQVLKRRRLVASHCKMQLYPEQSGKVSKCQNINIRYTVYSTVLFLIAVLSLSSSAFCTAFSAHNLSLPAHCSCISCLFC
jgi:hypothetical protein